MPVTGRCMCGAVQFVLSGPLRPVVNCHCSRCRRWTGHFMSATNSAVADLSFAHGADSVKWWTPPEEPAVAYASCADCGSSLFWRATDRIDSISIAAGTLDPPTGLETVHAIFVDEASDYHRLDSALPHDPHDSPGAWPYE